MAETLRDGVRVLADANADMLKSVASARGFLRNAQPLALPLPATVNPANDEQDDEEADDEEPEDDTLKAFALEAMTLANNLIDTFKKSKSTPAGSADGNGRAKPGFDLKSIFDWRRAKPQPSPVTENSGAPSIDASGPLPPAELLRLVRAMPSDLHPKLAAVREQLKPEEEQQLLWMISAIDPSELPQVLAEMRSKSVDELVTLFRALLEKPAAA